MKKPDHSLITQPCAECAAPYKVLKADAHWRNLCHICYSAQKAAKEAAADMATRMTRKTLANAALLALRERDEAPPKAPLWKLAYAAPPTQSRTRAALDDARSNLLSELDRATHGDATAAASVYGRVLRVAADHRRVWLPCVLGKCLEPPLDRATRSPLAADAAVHVPRPRLLRKGRAAKEGTRGEPH